MGKTIAAEADDLSHSPGRRARGRSRRLAAVTLVALTLAAAQVVGCAFQVPEPLANPDSDEALRVNARARDGCAFAGTWQMGDYNPSDDRYDFDSDRGIAVFDVVGRSIRGAVLPVSRDFHGNRLFPWPFTIIEGVIGPDGRMASGVKEERYLHTGVQREPVDLALADDGLTYRSGPANSESPWLEGEAGRKIRTGPCGVVVQFVSDWFDATRDGKPLPDAYTGFSWERLLSIGMPRRF